MLDITEARDGIWTIADAGEVSFRIRRGAIELLDASHREGWFHTLRRTEPDRLEVEFLKGGEEYEFEARYDNGVLTIAIEHELQPAEPGRYQVGPAGEVEIGLEEGALTLVDAQANPGWRMEIDEEGGEEVEVEFSRGAIEWDFEAEVDGGVLEVEIEAEVSGPVTPDTTG